METSAVKNEEQARYWNGDEAAHWLVHEGRYERMLAPFTRHLLTAAAIGRADRVVDIGCGTGSTTRAAGRVAIDGEALESSGIWKSLVRAADPPTVDRAREAVQAALEPYVTPDGLLLGSRAGLVTASRP
jgi:SAM-dependent methyltransferase